MSPRSTRALFAAVLLVAGIAVATPAQAAGGSDLAAGRVASASATNGSFTAANLTDGNQATYWEGTGAFPHWAQVDLGSSQNIDQVRLKLPAGWGERTQTLSVQGSPNGSTFSTIVPSATYSFGPANGNTVVINFGAADARYLRINITANTGWAAGQLSALEVYGVATLSTNLAVGRTIQVSGTQGGFPGSNANDSNQGSYWESANNAFPQWIQVDLGSSVSVNRLVLKLPTGWETRTQTLTVQSSANGSSFGTLVASAGYVFNPASGNTVTITFTATTTRYVRLSITANTGWPAGQVSEFEIYGPSTGDNEAPTTPGNLAYTQPATGQIRLTWNASTDNVGVTAYDVYANDELRTSVAGNVTTFTDNQPDGTTVSYYVRARDAAGNQSGNSNTVTRPGGPTGGTNLAVGKPITESGHVHTFVATNANDDNVGTYWESNGFPGTLTVQLGANASVNSIVLRLNPDPAWGTRQQTLQVLGREQSASGFTNLVAQQTYTFNPSSSNTVTIPVTATVADVQLRFTANTGAPGGQIAEFQVIGTPAPNPDLTVTGITASPAAPVETSAITLSATVRNAGNAASGATDVNFYLGTTLVGTAAVGGLAAGASATVSAGIGPRDAGTYQVTAKVDEDNDVIEQNDANNAFTSPTPLVVTSVSSSDLVAAAVGWTPNNPSNGNTVTFTTSIRNQGNIASAAGAHGITLTVLDDSGTVVRTLTGSYSGTIAAGATTPVVNLGTWTAANGRYTVRVVLANDGNELPVKQANNTSERPLFVGRGANMPFDILEAEDGTVGGGAAVVGPNRTIGDLAGEASGRRAVTLNQNGAFVQFTTRSDTNTLVTRFSIPDGTASTLNVYVNDVFHKAIPLTSKYAWLYGAEASPGNSPGAGSPRHIYDEANIFLNSTVPAGSRIKLQKDAANSGTFAIDFVSTEQVSQVGNPDPARYTTPGGFTHQDVQNALDRVRMDTTGNLVGVYLPAGEYATSSKFQVYGKAVRVVGAGAWYTRFVAPQNQENTDIGFRVESAAAGSLFTGFSYFGNYTQRNDGPGKVFDLQNVSGLTIDGIWAEHQMCLFWGLNTDNMTIRNNRIRNSFADAVNMTNGSTGNLVSNNEARATGDDSFALFAATDGGGGEQRDNVFENLTSILTWRAAGVAVYGGFNNQFRNLYIADTLVYSGVTISSLDFGIPMDGFGASPPTVFDGVTIVRAGGHFWGAQTFPGIWVYSATKVFQGIRVNNVDIVDPTYHGIMFQTDYVGGQPLFPVADTIFTNVSISGAQRSGDAFDAKSGFGIWANELPEPGEGPARGSVTFNNLRFSNNFQNIRNTTTTFTINVT